MLMAKRAAAEQEFKRFAVEFGLQESDVHAMIQEARLSPQQNPHLNAIYEVHQKLVLMKESFMMSGM